MNTGWFVGMFPVVLALCRSAAGGVLPPDATALKLYPHTSDGQPNTPSPGRRADGTEVVVVFTKEGRYGVVSVTVENGPLNLPYGSHKIGKGRQLNVDANDFPTLARTGLHAESELYQTETITGRLLEGITTLGRPGSASGEGFMAADEDVLSVLTGDNRLVQSLGLTHPQLARPLFHVWNLILREYELGRMGRFWDNIRYLLYGGKKIRFSQVHPTRGFQPSIFADEITGAFDISFFRELDESERAFLCEKYPHLSKEQMGELLEKLSHMKIGEMEPYYIMRYGFYEGHTGYRADPIAIAFIFGLRTVQEIEAALPGRLHEVLSAHFVGVKPATSPKTSPRKLPLRHSS